MQPDPRPKSTEKLIERFFAPTHLVETYAHFAKSFTVRSFPAISDFYLFWQGFMLLRNVIFTPIALLGMGFAKAAMHFFLKRSRSLLEAK